MLRALLPLSCVLVSCSCLLILISPFMGHPASPFIGEGKARVTVEKNEKDKREKNASRIVGSFFSFMRVPLIL